MYLSGNIACVRGILLSPVRQVNCLGLADSSLMQLLSVLLFRVLNLRKDYILIDFFSHFTAVYDGPFAAASVVR